MLDIDLIRTERDNVARALAKRMEPADVERVIDEIIELDAERRRTLQEVEAARQKRRANARAYAEVIRGVGAPQDAPGTTPEGGEKDLADLEADLAAVQTRLRALMSELPNLPSEDTVPGGKEANRVLYRYGEQTKLDQVRDHVQISKALGLIDFERGVKLGGSGFWIYTGLGAQLEWALVNWFVDQHLKADYTFMLPPHLLLESAGFAAGQFPKFYDDVFHIETNESRGQFLLPTAETAILGAYANEVVDSARLPIKAFAYTPCYRRERAGSHSDERGTVRGHQFNKVEIFQFVEPDEALAALDEMVEHAESLVAGLGLHFQRVQLAAEDASASMRKTIDIEVWMPSTAKYREVSSVSWAGDYQARRAGIRYRETGVKRNRFLHTLNGSALATSRIFPAILEQNQQPDGSVLVPEVLQSRVGADYLRAPSKKTGSRG